MRTIVFLFLILITCYTSASAQVISDVTATSAVDFTATDSDGKVHNLYSYLEDDYHVLLMFAIGG